MLLDHRFTQASQLKQSRKTQPQPLRKVSCARGAFLWGALATCALSICAFSAFASYAQGAPEPQGNTPPAQTQQDNPPQQSQQNLIPIDAEHFPDAMFRSLIEKYVDTPQSTGVAGDKKLSADEIASAKRLNIDWVSGGAQSDVYDFKGIEYLTALEELHFIGTPGDSLKTVKLDVSKNTQLKKLDGTWAALKHLDLSHNTKLEELTVNGSGLEGELDLSHNTALKNVQCFNTKLAAVSLPKTSTLTNVNVSNTKIRQLDVAGLSNLETLNVSQCALEALDVSSCTNLKQLYVQKSALHMLDVSACKQLKNLDISNAALLGITFGENIPEMLVGEQTTQKVRLTSASNSIDLKTYASSIDPACIQDLKNATLSGTTLTVINPSSTVTYNYRFGNDTSDCLSVELTLDVQGSAETSAQPLATLFPDKALCAYMTRFDTNNDGALSADELEKITELEICGAPSGATPSGAAQAFDRTAKLDAAHAIYSFAGIERLKNLQVFKFAGNESSDQQAERTIHLDLSKNTQLTTLVVQSDEALDALNVASLSKLEQLVVIGSSAKKVPLTLKSSILTVLQGIHVEHCVIDKADKLGLSFAQSPQLKTASIIDTNAKQIDFLNNKQLSTAEVRDNVKCSTLRLSSFTSNWRIERNTKLAQLSINAGKMTLDDIRAAYKACLQPTFLTITNTSEDVAYVFDAAFDGLDELDLSGDAKNVEVKSISSLSTLDVTSLANLKTLDVSTLPALVELSYETTLKELKLLQNQRDKLADSSNTDTKITVVAAQKSDTHSGDQPGTSGHGSDQPGTTTEQPSTLPDVSPVPSLSPLPNATPSTENANATSPAKSDTVKSTEQAAEADATPVVPAVLNITEEQGSDTGLHAILNEIKPYQEILQASRALPKDAPRVQLSEVTLKSAASQAAEKPQIVCATLEPSALSSEYKAQYTTVLNEISKLGDSSKAVLFDVSMIANKELKHDNFGSLSFSLSVPKASDGRFVAVWHMHQSGEITKQFVPVKNGKASVTVSDLSMFAYTLMPENFVPQQANTPAHQAQISADNAKNLTAPVSNAQAQNATSAKSAGMQASVQTPAQANGTQANASADKSAPGSAGMPRTADTAALLMAFALSVCSVVILCAYRRFSTHR